MSSSPTALLVAPTDYVAHRAITGLTNAGLRVVLVSSFAAARERLESHPDLLVSEVRLREHNGLHLAMRARSEGIPAILLGQQDVITAREAERLGAAYLSEDCDADALGEALRTAGVAAPAGKRRKTHAA